MGFRKTSHPNIEIPKIAKLYQQTYDAAKTIDGVSVQKAMVFADDYGGWFKESMRLDQYGHHLGLKNIGIDFKPIQTNTSYLAPKTKRFWHIHPLQNEVWTTSGTILIGLIDFRPKSKTYGTKMKVTLSYDKSLFIPHGVAHGFINPSTDIVVLSYATDHYFTADDSTQEYRISPQKIPYDFVKSDLM